MKRTVAALVAGVALSVATSAAPVSAAPHAPQIQAIKCALC